MEFQNVYTVSFTKPYVLRRGKEQTK